MESEEMGLKDWEESPTRNRIRALSEVMHDIVKAAKNQGFNFAEIMTALDAFQIELAVRHNISPAVFEEAMVNVCNHYDRIYKRHQDENRTD